MAATWEGRAFAIAGILAGTTPFFTVLAWDVGKRTWKRWASIQALSCGAILGFLVIRAPSGNSTATAAIQNLRLDRDPHSFLTWFSNLLPEVDHLMLCYTLASWIDPLLTAGQTEQLKRLTKEHYRQLEKDPEFHALGTAMSDSYAEVLMWGPSAHHAYLYVPAKLDRSKPAPALIFFHGSGGNFKAYLWLLSRIADDLNMVVIAPTCGMGNWSAAETEQVASQALTAAAKQVRLDSNRLHFMGLSNGGLGVSKFATTNAARFESLIFISPVFDRPGLGPEAFRHVYKNRPVLVLTGETDNRIPLSYVRDSVNELRQAGARVTLQVVPNANHFLFFSHPAQVRETLENWLHERD
ncbi:MAG: hypothetical protein JWM32_2746 [Verrucomicrobia bacterium]|nr:hypothetical protein [Verrucomicrobiota bacterium]